MAILFDWEFSVSWRVMSLRKRRLDMELLIDDLRAK